MSHASLESAVNAAWETRDTLNVSTKGAVRDAVEEALSGLDSGDLRVAQKTDAGWVVNQWLKKAVLLSFRLNANETIPGAPGGDVIVRPSSKA